MADMPMEEFLEEVAFGPDGLVPAVAQDAFSGEVLMLAWMNRDAVRLTLESGRVHYYSRSRREMWRKGDTSGNIQNLVEMRIDCDSDAVLVRVDQTGPACHKGARSCFHCVVERKGSSVSVRKDKDRPGS